MANKRKFSTFSLSFLDIMSCGFGAVILVFLIIRHDVNTQTDPVDTKLAAEVNLLNQEVIEGQENLVEVKNTLSLLNQEFVETNGLARRINDDVSAIDNMIIKLDQASDEQQILELEQKLKKLVLSKKALEEQEKEGNDARRFSGQGERQYLTGLKLGGARILILLDTSASMLDSSIVNVIRRRNMPNTIKQQAPKWQRAIKAVEWLIAKFPLDSQFQLYGFDTDVVAAAPSTANRWLNISDQNQLNQVVQGLHKLVPAGGTNLNEAFRAISSLDPLPDNIILLTDSLPTIGAEPSSSNTITGKQREALFEEALTSLPQGIPVNVLLWPMEGDPIAASAFWRLAQYTSGSFMSPSLDWP